MYSPIEFKELAQEFQEHEEKLLDWKAGEYSIGKDRLQNFEMIAKFTGLRPEQIALLYLLKHIQSITLATMSTRYIWGWETEEGEGLKQRIADARNYLLLLAACLDEKQKTLSAGNRLRK